MKPVCRKCCLLMTLENVGVTVGIVVRGILYQIWSGDHWMCHTCKAELISNYGAGPIWAQHEARQAPPCTFMVPE